MQPIAYKNIKVNYKMLKTMWSDMQVPRSLMWWVFYQLLFTVQMYIKKYLERTVQRITTSSLNKYVCHLNCFMCLSFLKLASRPCFESKRMLSSSMCSSPMLKILSCGLRLSVMKFQRRNSRNNHRKGIRFEERQAEA